MNSTSSANITPFVAAMTNVTAAANKSTSGSKLWYLVPVFVILVGALIAAAFWNWSKWASSPWWSDRAQATKHFWDLFGGSGSAIDPGKLVGADSLFPETSENTEIQRDQAKARERVQETWCFVGEDYSGRWCLKVPTSRACDPDRSFASRSDCEYTEASSMPLGVQTNGGDSIVPLSEIPVMSYAVNKDSNKEEMRKQLALMSSSSPSSKITTTNPTTTTATPITRITKPDASK